MLNIPNKSYVFFYAVMTSKTIRKLHNYYKKPIRPLSLFLDKDTWQVLFH